MRRITTITMLTLLALTTAAATLHADEDHPLSLDDFFASAARVHDVKVLALAMLSQQDDAVAAQNTAEIRRSFWASRPEAGLTDAEAEVALKEFDHDWSKVVHVVRERKMKSLMFTGIDLVLLTKAEDWYFGAVTPRGPVLIRVSVQANENAPMSLHGIKVWTKWDEIKAITHAIDIPAGRKVLTVTYEGSGNSAKTTTQ